MACTHQHGAKFGDLWICGQCWKPTEQPVHYGMVDRHIHIRGGEGGGSSAYHTVRRQEVIWRAPDRIAASGLSMTQFLAAMVEHIRKRSGMPEAGALDAALAILSGYDLEFGASSEDWTAEAAQAVVDDDMEYWDLEEERDGN